MMRDCGNCIYQRRCRQLHCTAGRPTPWHESPEEIAAGLAWGDRKSQLMRWIKRHMDGTLSRRQREVVELHLFRGMTFKEIARVTKTDRSTVHRAMQRSIVRLQRLWSQADDKPKGPKPRAG